MKTCLLLCQLICVCPFLSNAQRNPKTILWEVSKSGTPYKSYLFGTFHQVNPAFFDSLKNTNAKLKTSTTLFVETTAQSEPNAVAEAKHDMYSWNSYQWNNVLTVDQKDVFGAFVTKADDSVYYSLSPIALSVALQYSYLQNICDNAGRESYQPMDFHIVEMGRKNHLQVLSLDADQLQILQASQKQDSLLSIQENVNTCIGNMKKILTDDKSDCDVISKYKSFEMDYEFSKRPSGMEILLENRNKKWMDILPKAFEKESCFVAVGFRHLFYDYGLVESLKKLGYSVKPISTN